MNFSPFLKALGVLVGAMLVVYLAGYFYNQNNLKLLTFYDKPVLEDTSGNIATIVHPGQPVIMNFFVERHSSRCHAEHIQLLEGPVSVQFDSRRSQIISNHTIRRHDRHLYTIPAGLPEGRYTWSHLIYPTCGGVDVTPYIRSLGITVDVVE
jgi:hypothetical protein